MNDEAIKKLIMIYSELETKLLDEIVSHFNINEEFINSDYWRIEKISELGLMNENIVKYIAEVTNRTSKEIKIALQKIAKENLNMNRLNEAYKGGFLEINPIILIQNQVIENLINFSYNELTNRFLEISNKIENATREAYLDIVEKAYIQTTNGFTYKDAIRNALLDLGDKGISTLTYKTIDENGNIKGIRHYDVEGTVRREIITASHNLTNEINRSIAEELDVEYLYLSEHIKCRPEHFSWQGTIIKREELVKVTRYGEVDGLGGPNCKHYPTPYFGDARGKDLKQISLEDATEQYNLSQQQRYLERGIRKWKRKERIFKNADDKEYYKKCRNKVKEWQLRNKAFTEKNNFKRDFSRENVEKVTKIKNNDKIAKNVDREEKKLSYTDITNEMYNLAKPNKGKVKKQKYFETDGRTYLVDGHNVVYKHDERELEVARLLNKTFGGNVKILPNINFPQGIKSPDYLYKGEKTDLKRITSKRVNDCVKTALKNKEKQANNFIIDNTAQTVRNEDILKQIDEIYNSKGFGWIDKIYLLNDDKFIKIFKRK